MKSCTASVGQPILSLLLTYSPAHVRRVHAATCEYFNNQHTHSRQSHLRQLTSKESTLSNAKKDNSRRKVTCYAIFFIRWCSKYFIIFTFATDRASSSRSCIASIYRHYHHGIRNQCIKLDSSRCKSTYFPRRALPVSVPAGITSEWVA